jgi:hypothetical protein
MSKILNRLLGVALVAVAPLAVAAPCVPGTLQDYFDLVGGCEIGVTSFSEFTDIPGPSGGTPIDPTLILVTPGSSVVNPHLTFTFDRTATGTDFFDNVFRFLVSGTTASTRFNGARATLNGASATGNGVVTLVEDLCEDGTFDPLTPTGCTGAPETLIALATEFVSIPSASTTLGSPISFFDVFADIGIDGGLAGTASLVSATLAFALVPEPPMFALLLVALAALAVTARRRLPQ